LLVVEQAMLNPLGWKDENRLRLLFVSGFGALVGFATDYLPGDLWFNLLRALIGAVVVCGAFYCYQAFW
jgi:hypothetical protein